MRWADLRIVEPIPIIDMISKIHSLDRVPRAGFLLRGVTEPESVAAHSHSLALLCSLVCRSLPGQFDETRVVAMALIHDLPEVETMDIPMPAGTEEFKRAKDVTESNVMKALSADVDSSITEIYLEYASGSTNEAKLVKGLDKVQMMIKVLGYEREGRGVLEDFWINPKNFATYELAPVEKLFGALFERAGRTPPNSTT